ncbi:MAG: hypothetical protein U0441_01625 [Polyangiaceae bacterium]
MPRSSLLRRASKGLFAPLLCALSLSLAGCPEVQTTAHTGRDAISNKWFERAKAEMATADFEEAKDSVDKALTGAPDDVEVKLLAAQVHLAMLDYAEAVRLLRDVHTSQAAALRGRALWYKGDLEGAADELEAMLNDPDIVDDWAKSIAKLARRGAGRAPFTISGALLGAVEMPHVSPAAPFFVVPVEIDGEPALSLVSTGFAEVVLDSTTHAEPSWISLRFGGRLEVNDVPALAQDLSGLSKQVGAPIKAVLGVNLLRHLHATIDFGGRQFVARSFSPPPPPDATRVSLYYWKGGGMLMKGSLGPSAASMLIDTAMALPVALDEAGWKKAGIDAKELKVVPDDPEKKLKEGTIPLLKVGSYEISQVPGYFNDQVKTVEEKLAFNIDGMVGNGLLAYYRMTFGDGGRILWLEDNLSVQRILSGNTQPAGPRLTPPGEGPIEGAPTQIVPEPPPPEPVLKNPVAPNKGPGDVPRSGSSNPGPKSPKDSSKGP